MFIGELYRRNISDVQQHVAIHDIQFFDQRREEDLAVPLDAVVFAVIMEVNRILQNEG